MKYFLIFTFIVIWNFIEIEAGNGYIYKKNTKKVHHKIQSDFIEENLDHLNTFNSTSDSDPEFKAFRKCESCHCGRPNHNRIVGGTEVRYNKYPWISQLLYDGRFYCGGTLINNRYILTAAHCTTGFKPNRMQARLNQYDRSAKNVKGITRDVIRIIAHKDYNTQTLNNDIALLELDQPIPLQSTLRPACLPKTEQRFTFQTGIAAGWGLTKEGGSTSQILNEVYVPIISNGECKQTLYRKMITENMLCAGNVKQGGKDACQGDSGGPLIVGTNGAYKLAGVVSYGYGCARPNAPGVYARVSKYLKWINDNTANACYCNQ